jgi:hypothetical protein
LILKSDSAHSQPITEPESLEAMEALGVTAPDLSLPAASGIAAVGQEFGHLDMAHHQEYAQRLISQATLGRLKVVQLRRGPLRTAAASQAQLPGTPDLE